jgi:hypothetical protein
VKRWELAGILVVVLLMILPNSFIFLCRLSSGSSLCGNFLLIVGVIMYTIGVCLFLLVQIPPYLEERSKGKDGWLASRIVPFVGFSILMGGLFTYLYSVSFQIGFDTSTTYPHRDLGTLLIPTGLAVMLGGITLHVVRKKLAPSAKEES